MKLEHILECPRCGGAFAFRHEESFPAVIACPHCKSEGSTESYSALVFCPSCRAKLSMSLDLLGAERLTCPACGIEFADSTVSDSMLEKVGGASQEPMERRLLEDGANFDKYRIERLIGVGGMAQVYLATHLMIDRRCALKVMKPDVCGSGVAAAQRFVQEARISQSVDCDITVEVYDAGQDSKTRLLFIAMEYVEGQTLESMLKTHRFTEHELRNVGEKVSEALCALWKRGIVHRDIKPSNIIQCKDGTLRLMDMGIAKMAANHSEGQYTMTMAGGVLGTPAYASPEQCRSAHDADVRSDIYSLGATLYHLASGRAPFQGESAMELVVKVIEGKCPPPPLRSLRPDLSSDFVRQVDSMMERDPAKRPQCPESVMEGMGGRNRRIRNRRAMRMGVVVLLAVLLVVGGWWYWQVGQERAGLPLSTKGTAPLETPSKEAGQVVGEGTPAQATVEAEKTDVPPVVRKDAAAQASGAESTSREVPNATMEGQRDNGESQATDVAAALAKDDSRVPQAVENGDADSREPTAVENGVAEKTEPAAVENGVAERTEPAAVENGVAEKTEPGAVENGVAEKTEPAAVENGVAEKSEPAVVEAVPKDGGGKLLVHGKSVPKSEAPVVIDQATRAERMLLAQLRRLCSPFGMVLIKPGSFQMGEDGSRRMVTLTKPYLLGKTEVSQELYKKIMGSCPARNKSDAHPVERVSWENARRFCEAMNKRYGDQLPKGYCFSLPTEAQWEYACRAGKKGESAASLSAVAWYGANSGRCPHDCGEKAPNAWGLCDMFGNVWEWCLDWHGKYPHQDEKDPTGPSSGEFRVIRGGGWGSTEEECRYNFRGCYNPKERGNHIGFRLAIVPKGQ